MLLQCTDVSVSFGERTLFSGVNFIIEENDRIGLAGVNGAGKTTLFKMLSGLEPEDMTGRIIKRGGLSVGFMEQHVLRGGDISVYEEALSVFEPLVKLERELEELHSRIDSGETDGKILERQMRVTEEFQNGGGLTFRARTESALIGMGFSAEDLDKPVGVLSGGERSKLQLVKLLLSGAELLLLDEPTNHLDIAASEWLEAFLRDMKGAYVVISHDKYFLDKVTDKTFALDNGTLGVYKGNYSSYLRQYDERAAYLAKKYSETAEEIHRIEGIIEQQKRFNQEHNYVTIRSKEKQIERLKKELVPPPPPRRKIKFSFPCRTAHGTDAVTVSGLSFRIGGRTLFENADLEIKYGERVFLLGANGCGKSTLMKTILGKIPVQGGGKVKIADWLKVGYFDQLQEMRLTSEKSALDFVWDDFPRLSRTQVRSGLALFGLYGDELLKPVKDMSGGEAAKIVLLKIMLEGPNMLMLDEPTNHLDLEAREALLDALSDYKGTMLVISHDRTMINALATKLMFLSPKGVEIFNENYDEWKEAHAADHTINNNNNNENKEKNAENPYKKQKELQSRQRKARTRLKRLEEEIEELDGKIEGLNGEIAEFSSDYVKVAELSERLSEAQEKQKLLLDEWELLDKEFENLT